MKTSLITKLDQLTDIRRAEGKRHNLTLIIILTIMAIMSQCFSLRGVETFINRHREELIRILNLKKDRLPSYPTIRRVLKNVDFNELSEIFKEWVLENNLMSSDDWISIDGKSIKSTVTNCQSIDQNYVNIVTAFTHHTGLVLASKSFQHKKVSEIPIVENMIKTLGLENMTFTLDALHSKKNS
jgi:hypothetical protein